RKFGMVVHLHHHAIGAEASGSACQRRDHVGIAAAMRRIEYHRQMRDAPNSGYGGKIERVSRMLSEGADSTFAKDHIVVALTHDILGCQQPLFESSCHSALQKNRQL